MPEISRFYGIVIYMFYNNHSPPYFHMKYQEYEATFEIEMGIIRGDMPKTAMKLINEWVEQHKEELLNNWNMIKERKPLKKIEPLK